MTIHRSSRGAKKHDHVVKGVRLKIHGAGCSAIGIALDDARVYAFKKIPAADIRDGYYVGARTRPTLLSCLRDRYKRKELTKILEDAFDDKPKLVANNLVAK